jgi:hypothetical protein
VTHIGPPARLSVTIEDMSNDSGPSPGSALQLWAAAANLGEVCWFFGNFYEGIVDVPRLLSDAQQQRRPGLLTPGSPLRYYAPIAPVTITATTAALSGIWRAGGDRRMVVAATVSTAVAVALTGYLVRTVNVRLLSNATPPRASETERMIKAWHRANNVRLAAVAGALFALRRAARSVR